MAHAGRLLFAIIFLVGLAVGWRRLSALGVASADVALTGLAVIGGIVLLFAVIPFVGRLLGKLVPNDDDR